MMDMPEDSTADCFVCRKQWPQARRGGTAEIEGLVRDLRGYLADGSDLPH
jgi:hypothetical protein